MAIAQRRFAGGAFEMPPPLRGRINGPSEIVAGCYSVSGPGRKIGKARRAAENSRLREEARAARAAYERGSAACERPTLPDFPEPPEAVRVPWEDISFDFPTAAAAAAPATFELKDSGVSAFRLNSKGEPLALGTSAFYIKSKKTAKNGKPLQIKISIFRAEIVCGDKLARSISIVRRTSDRTLAATRDIVARSCGAAAAARIGRPE